MHARATLFHAVVHSATTEDLAQGLRAVDRSGVTIPCHVVCCAMQTAIGHKRTDVFAALCQAWPSTEVLTERWVRGIIRVAIDRRQPGMMAKVLAFVDAVAEDNRAVWAEWWRNTVRVMKPAAMTVGLDRLQVRLQQANSGLQQCEHCVQGALDAALAVAVEGDYAMARATACHPVLHCRAVGGSAAVGMWVHSALLHNNVAVAKAFVAAFGPAASNIDAMKELFPQECIAIDTWMVADELAAVKNVV